MARLAEDIAAVVADRVGQLAGWVDQPGDVLFGGRQSVAQSATAVLEVAEAAGMDAVGSVARGICVLLEEPADPAGWQAEALRVHLRALVFVHAQPRAAEAACLPVVEELRALRTSLGFTE